MLNLKIISLKLIKYFKAKSKKGNEEYWKSLEVPEVKKTAEENIALTRDWLGRENPDKTPFYGFFPVWPAMLMAIAGKFMLFKSFYLFL